MLGAFLEEIRLVGVAGETIVLAMDDLHRSVIDSPEHRSIVQDELGRAFGRALALRCTPAPETSAQRSAGPKDVSPMIERVIEMFDGEVIDRAGRGGDRSA